MTAIQKTLPPQSLLREKEEKELKKSSYVTLFLRVPRDVDDYLREHLGYDEKAYEKALLSSLQGDLDLHGRLPGAMELRDRLQRLVDSLDVEGDAPRSEGLVPVVVWLPRQVDGFVRALSAFTGVKVEEFYRQEILAAVSSIVEQMNAPYLDSRKLKDLYGLSEAFKRWNI